MPPINLNREEMAKMEAKEEKPLTFECRLSREKKQKIEKANGNETLSITRSNSPTFGCQKKKKREEENGHLHLFGYYFEFKCVF